MAKVNTLPNTTQPQGTQSNLNTLYGELNNTVREINGEVYKQSSEKKKTELIGQIVNSYYNRYIVDYIKSNTNIFNKFVKNKHEFGVGWMNIGVGLAEIDEFTSDPTKRYPNTRKINSIFAETFEQDVKDYIRLTVSEVEMKNVFQNQSQMTSLIQNIMNSITHTWNVRNHEFMKKVFGGTPNTTYLKPGSVLDTVADELQQSLNNTIQYDHNADDPQKINKFVRKINEVIAHMGVEPSDSYHALSTIKGVPTINLKEDLMLILSIDDKLEFEQQVLPNQYHKDQFNLPNMETILMKIPKGTAYIIHKDWLQISPHFSTTETEFYTNTLDTDYVSHLQFKIGYSKVLTAVKITGNQV